MTCIAKGSLVELIDIETSDVKMVPIETVQSGDVVHNPLGNADIVENVYVQDTGGFYSTYCVGGLRGDGEQWIARNGEWIKMKECGVSACQESCSHVVGIVLREGRHMIIDGVICVTYNVHDMPAPIPYHTVRVWCGNLSHALSRVVRVE